MERSNSWYWVYFATKDRRQPSHWRKGRKRRCFSVDFLLIFCWFSLDFLLMFCWFSVDCLLIVCWLSIDFLLIFWVRLSIDGSQKAQLLFSWLWFGLFCPSSKGARRAVGFCSCELDLFALHELGLSPHEFGLSLHEHKCEYNFELSIEVAETQKTMILYRTTGH